MIKLWVIMVVGLGIPQGTAIQNKGETLFFQTQEECELNKAAFDEYATYNIPEFADGYIAHTCVAVNKKTI